MGHRPRALLVATLALIAVGSAALGGRQFPLSVPTPNPSASLKHSSTGARWIDEPFFENLGTSHVRDVPYAKPGLVDRA